MCSCICGNVGRNESEMNSGRKSIVNVKKVIKSDIIVTHYLET